MTAKRPSIGLRPYLPSDALMLADIFRESIYELTGEDYRPNQQAEWAALADDEEDFEKRLSGALTLVATIESEPVGFASLKGKDLVDMLFVLPSAAKQGVATALLDALEKLAAARGARRLLVHASDTARDLFERRGFRAQRRNSVPLGSEWLANTTMEKALPAADR
jgi:putative acetyltransferase